MEAQVIMPYEIAMLAVKQWLTAQEAGMYLDLSADKVRRLAASRELAHSRRGAKLYFKKSDLDAWLEQSRVESDECVDMCACTYTAATPYNHGRKRRG